MNDRGVELHGVVVVGSVNIDLSVRTDAFPQPGETILGADLVKLLGGKGANQAVAAAITAGSAALVARVGTDDDASWAVSRLAARGVEVDSVRTVSGLPTGTAFITVAGGENTIIVVAGANAGWTDALGVDVQVVRDAAVVLTQQEVPVDVVVAASHACSGRFVLNASPVREFSDELLAVCDPLLVNEHELAAIAGTGRLTELHEVSAAHDLVIGRGARSVVTTLGPRGAAVRESRSLEDVIVPGVVIDDVVDTTGAGDAFAGTLAARLAAGDALVPAVRWAIAASALSVLSVGAQESYRPRSEIEAALAKLPGIPPAALT